MAGAGRLCASPARDPGRLVESAARAFLTPGPVSAEALAAQAISSYDAVAEASAGPAAVGPIAPAPGQPTGALSGRIVFTSGGHGWVYTTGWVLQRGIQYEMNEDYGNVDQVAMFVFYCFNAGATVVPLRRSDTRPTKSCWIMMSAGVTFSGAWTTVTSDPVYYGSLGGGFRQASASCYGDSDGDLHADDSRGGILSGLRLGAAWRESHQPALSHSVIPAAKSQVRVPHHMVGNGWVYLGTYYFNAGSNSANGAVIISNLQPGAWRDGRGDRGRHPLRQRHEQRGAPVIRARKKGHALLGAEFAGARAEFVHLSFARGQRLTSRTGKARPKMASEMNREQSGAKTKRLYISFHSNARINGSARGTVGLYNNTTRHAQPDLVRHDHAARRSRPTWSA